MHIDTHTMNILTHSHSIHTSSHYYRCSRLLLLVPPDKTLVFNSHHHAQNKNTQAHIQHTLIINTNAHNINAHKSHRIRFVPNRFKLVRRIRTKGHVTEKDFWSNFFFHIKLVKDSMRRFQSLGDLVTELPDTIDKEYVPGDMNILKFI